MISLRTADVAVQMVMELGNDAMANRKVKVNTEGPADYRPLLRTA